MLLEAPRADRVEGHAGGDHPRDGEHEEPGAVSQVARDRERQVKATETADGDAGSVELAERAVQSAGPVGEPEPDLYEPRAYGQRATEQVEDESRATRPEILGVGPQRVVSGVVKFLVDKPEQRCGEDHEHRDEKQMTVPRAGDGGDVHDRPPAIVLNGSLRCCAFASKARAPLARPGGAVPATRPGIGCGTLKWPWASTRSCTSWPSASVTSCARQTGAS